MSLFGSTVLTLRRAHIVDMAAAEVNSLSQRGGREGEQLAMAQVRTQSLRYRSAPFNALPLSCLPPLPHRVDAVVQAAADRARRALEEEQRRCASTPPSIDVSPLVYVLLWRVFHCNDNSRCFSGWTARRRCATCCRCSVARVDVTDNTILVLFVCR